MNNLSGENYIKEAKDILESASSTIVQSINHTMILRLL